MPNYILAHDLGTSGDKASLFREDGKLVASALRAYETYYPNRGWAEQEPGEWWRAVVETTKEITSDIEASDIAAISFSGQMMGTVCLDEHGAVLGRSILWSDGRAEAQAQKIVERVGLGRSCRIAGQRVGPFFPLAKIMWLKQNHPEIYDKTIKVLQAKDYIAFRMTGRMATEVTDAAFTQAYDTDRGDYSQEMIGAADVRADIFPEVLKSSDVVGKLSQEAAALCGLLEGTPVVAGAGDGAAATVGAGCVDEGQAYTCIGSSSWIKAASNRFLFDEKLRMQIEPHVIAGKYVYGGTMQTGGLSYAWARENLTDNTAHEKIEELIGSSAPGASGALFLPYLMGERCPWWDTDANGSFLGLRIGTTKADMLRAVIEGVALNLNILLKVVREDIALHEMVLIGGGANGRAFPQVIADIYGLTVLIPENTEGSTAIGAAVIAGVGVGMYRDYSASRNFLKVSRVINPREEYHELYSKKQEIFENAYRALVGTNHEISQL